MNDWVLSLQDVTADDADQVGGKAFQLARLALVGLPVPDAFVITVRAFSAHFPVATAAARPRPPELQPALVGAVRDALSHHFGAEHYLAVRSSALGEDTEESSYAGQHDTYYYVAPEAVPQAVRDCWMSLWSAPARRYRALRDDGGPLAMAVIVQRMVQADRSGVCFTTDPTGRHPEQVWIESTWGLGAALVDGRVTPDRLLLDRSGNMLRRHIGRKRHKVAAALGNPQEARLEPVPAFQQSQMTLSDADAADIAALALWAEKLDGRPQDVEWAFEGSNLYVLQSRPVTTMPADERPATAGRWVLFKPLAENFSEPVTPMTADLFGRVLPAIGTFHRGHFYLNLDLAERLCPFRWSTAELVDALLLRGSVPRLAVRWWKLPLAGLAGALLYLLDGPSWHRTAHLTRHSLTAFASLCATLHNEPQRNALATLQRLVLGRHPLEPIGRRAFYVNVSATRYFLLLGVLEKLLARWAPGLDDTLIDRLYSGDGDTFSRHLVEGVRALADVARRDPALRRRLTATDPEDLAAAFAGLRDEHPFSIALTALLEQYGHRCMREMELATPRWREDPLPLLLMVRGYLKSEPARAGDPHMEQLLARDELRKALPGTWRWRIVDYLVRRIRYYVSLREDTRHYHAMAMDLTRSTLLDLEQRLLASGRLRISGDVFFLTWQELLNLQDGRLERREASARIRRRRRERRLTTRRGAPETLGVSDAPRAIPDTATPATLTGQCASPGSADGRARIVLDPATAHDLEPGDILVAPYTDPAWTPLFPLVRAVVVEVGSFLSHAGTIAREYGIPCLVDVDDCTTRLREGQHIRVLASEGRLELLE